MPGLGCVGRLSGINHPAASVAASRVCVDCFLSLLILFTSTDSLRYPGHLPFRKGSRSVALSSLVDPCEETFIFLAGGAVLFVNLHGTLYKVDLSSSCRLPNSLLAFFPLH